MSTEEELALMSLAVTGVKQIWTVVQAAKSGSMSASAALQHISAMLAGLPTAFAASDAKADAEVDARFGK